MIEPMLHNRRGVELNANHVFFIYNIDNYRIKSTKKKKGKVIWGYCS